MSWSQHEGREGSSLHDLKVEIPKITCPNAWLPKKNEDYQWKSCFDAATCQGQKGSVHKIERKQWEKGIIANQTTTLS